MSVQIQFEQTECGRCGGGGRMPFAVAGGRCFGCAGTGKEFTRAGRAARKRYEAWKLANLRRLAADLQPNDLIKVPDQSVVSHGGGVHFMRFKRAMLVREVRTCIVEGAYNIVDGVKTPHTRTDIVLQYTGPEKSGLRIDTAAQTLTISEHELFLVPSAAQLRAVAPTLGKGATLVDSTPQTTVEAA